MTLTQRTGEAPVMVRTYEYDDEALVAVDFAEVSAEPTVDVVDGTAIVVFDDEQYEIALPGDGSGAHTFMKNGVLSIELEDTR